MERVRATTPARRSPSTSPATPTIAALTDRPDAAAPGSGAPGSAADDEAAGIMLLELFAQALRRLLSGERPDLDPVEHAVDGVRALENRLDAAQRRPQIAREQLPGTPRVRLPPDCRQLDAEVAIGRDRRRRGRAERRGFGRGAAAAPRDSPPRRSRPPDARPRASRLRRAPRATLASVAAQAVRGRRAAGTAVVVAARIRRRSPPDPGGAAPAPSFSGAPAPRQLRAARSCPRPALRRPRPAPPRPRTPPSPRRAGDRAPPRPPAGLGPVAGCPGASDGAGAIPGAPSPRPATSPAGCPASRRRLRRRAAAEAARARAAGARAGRPARHRSTAARPHPASAARASSSA